MIITGMVAFAMPSDSLTISGRIRGYDPASGVRLMSVNVVQPVTYKTPPRVININPDGTFSRRINVAMPQYTQLIVAPRCYIDLYMTPSTDISLEFDLQEVIDAAARGEREVKYVDFGGALGRLNEELAALPYYGIIQTHTFSEAMSPDQAADSIMRFYDRQQAAMEEYIKELPADSEAPEIMRADLLWSRYLADRVCRLQRFTPFVAGGILFRMRA